MYTQKSSLHRSKTLRLASGLGLVVHGLLTTAFTTPARSIDGSGNNAGGQTDVQLQRGAFNGYADQVSSPARPAQASAREISNAVAAQTASTSNAKGATDLFWLWGQFLDHDIDLTEPATPAEPFNISVPQGDSHFDPQHTGQVQIFLDRSVYDPTTGTGAGNPRQQLNHITAFIDASNVYGSDSVRAAALRTFSDGLLATSAGDFMPFNVQGLPNAGGSDPTLFLAGDVRANEHVGLSAIHTLFVREHNRKAAELKAADPGLTDEELYQEARAYVGALMQVVTYKEFLPMLLGDTALPAYQGHDIQTDPGIHNFFSTAAYRLGHSMINQTLLRLDSNGAPVADGNLSLRDAFFSPEELSSDPGHGIEEILRGFSRQTAQEVDNKVIDDLRNFLFGPPGAGGFDLASLNIQRGRDHGLPDYNQARSLYGLPAVQSFAEISSDPAVQASLAQVYATVDDIDPWVGGLAEDHVSGAMVGPLFHAALVDQFTRLRDGDAFWYQLGFTGAELADLEATRLQDIIVRNTSVNYAELQGSVLQRPQLDSQFVEVCDAEIARVYLNLPSGPQIPASATVTGELLTADGSRIAIDTNAGNLLVSGSYELEWYVALNASDGFVIAQDLFVTENTSLVGCCPAGGVDIHGTSGSDFVYESSSVNFHVDAGAGSDFVMTAGGNDCVLGGEGSDALHGQAGDDQLRGGEGDDSMHCQAGGALRAWGGSGNDYIVAYSCDSAEIYGGSGDDHAVGSEGDDIIYPGSGRDNIQAGGGDDEVVIADVCELVAGSFLDGGLGVDTLRSPVGLTELAAAGVTVSGFESVVIDTGLGHLADCN